MATPAQREARALGDPTRHRLFRYIAEATQPVSVAELTGYIRLNHNAVRQHLAVLTDAGLVSGETETRSRPGRPRIMYRPHPEVAGRWGVADGYAWLAGVLAAAVHRKLGAREAGRREGHRRAAELAGPDDPVDALEAEMTRRGFRPARSGDGQTVGFALGHCPFADAVAAAPDTVCALHLGLAEGLATGLGGVAVQRLTPRDAPGGRCHLALRREPQAAGA